MIRQADAAVLLREVVLVLSSASEQEVWFSAVFVEIAERRIKAAGPRVYWERRCLPTACQGGCQFKTNDCNSVALASANTEPNEPNMLHHSPPNFVLSQTQERTAGSGMHGSSRTSHVQYAAETALRTTLAQPAPIGQTRSFTGNPHPCFPCSRTRLSSFAHKGTWKCSHPNTRQETTGKQQVCVQHRKQPPRRQKSLHLTVNPSQN